MNEFTVRLDLAKGKARQQQTVFVRQGDKNATTIVATITDHGAAAATSGLTARFQMRLPNGTEYYRKAASLSGNVATVALDEAQAASVAGRTDVAYFQLLQGSTVVASTESFTVVVLPDALADAEVADSYDSAIQDAIDALDAAVEQMPDMVEDVLADHPEWTTTVQDGSITKAKLATDLARDRERLLYRLANMLTATLPEGETATATDAAKTPVAGLALYGRSTQDGTPTPDAPVPIVSVGAANLLPDHPQRMDSGKGVTFTDNGDGSYGISGTATANAYIYLTDNSSNFKLPAGTYTLCVRDGNGADVAGVRAGASRWVNGANTTYGIAVGAKTFAHTGEGNVQLIIEVTNGSTVNATVWPCLYAGSTAYPYVPYGNIGLYARRTSDASEQTVTHIPLDGHELRSLPDGTRDEVTVDEYGHAVLVQRVMYVEDVTSLPVNGFNVSSHYITFAINFAHGVNSQGLSAPNTMSTAYPGRMGFMAPCTYVTGFGGTFLIGDNRFTGTQAEALALLSGVSIQYALATPVTIDLGYVDAVPLCGPDLTAQAIPTAPMQLTYERDLNTTLARLESAIATLV